MSLDFLRENILERHENILHYFKWYYTGNLRYGSTEIKNKFHLSIIVTMNASQSTPRFCGDMRIFDTVFQDFCEILQIFVHFWSNLHGFKSRMNTFDSLRIGFVLHFVFV